MMNDCIIHIVRVSLTTHPHSLHAIYTLEPTPDRRAKFTFDDFIISFRCHARSRQAWLSLFSLDLSRHTMAQWANQFSGHTHDTKVLDIEESFHEAIAAYRAAVDADRDRKETAVHHLGRAFTCRSAQGVARTHRPLR